MAYETIQASQITGSNDISKQMWMEPAHKLWPSYATVALEKDVSDDFGIIRVYSFYH